MATNPAQSPCNVHLRNVDCQARYRISRPTWDRMKKRPGFPAPLMLSSKTPVWRTCDLDAWDASCIAAASASTSNQCAGVAA